MLGTARKLVLLDIFPGPFAALREAGILVKNLHGWHPLLANTLRLSVGTEAENDALLRVMQSV